MRVLIAPDSFKESLTASEVCEAVEEGLRRVFRRGLRCDRLPLADGGEGTTEALVEATGGRLHRVRVHDALMRPMTAAYGMLGDGRTAVIETAAASGLPRLAPRERNPLRTSSYGTGELVRAALDRGAERIILGLGGSATNDCGAGLAMALGLRCRGAGGRVLSAVRRGGNLDQVRTLDLTGLHDGLARAEFLIASDVENPLCGPLGASAVFGPQKGASAAQVRRLDVSLGRFGRLLEESSGRAVADRPGAGAAGGIGAMMLALTRARLRPGIDIVMETVGFSERLRGADLVITGEGRIDSQTLHGKTVSGVMRRAKRRRVPVVAVGGGLTPDARELFAAGLAGMEASVCRPMPVEEAMADARQGVADAAERIGRMIRLGGAINSK